MDERMTPMVTQEAGAPDAAWLAEYERRKLAYTEAMLARQAHYSPPCSHDPADLATWQSEHDALVATEEAAERELDEWVALRSPVAAEPQPAPAQPTLCPLCGKPELPCGCCSADGHRCGTPEPRAPEACPTGGKHEWTAPGAMGGFRYCVRCGQLQAPLLPPLLPDYMDAETREWMDAPMGPLHDPVKRDAGCETSLAEYEGLVSRLECESFADGQVDYEGESKSQREARVSLDAWAHGMVAENARLHQRISRAFTVLRIVRTQLGTARTERDAALARIAELEAALNGVSRHEGGKP